MRKALAMALVLLAALASAPGASADWAEVDTTVLGHSLPGTAEAVTGGGPLNAITGSIASGSDADVYRIFISNPALFSATTGGTPGSLGDTQLYLLSTSGAAIIGNDDTVGLRSTIPAGFPGSGALPAGEYLLAITGFDRDPVDAANLELFTDNFGGLATPIAGRGPLAGWNGSSASGTYTINLTGADVVPQAVPEPASMVLLGLGAASAVGYRLRRSRRAA